MKTGKFFTAPQSEKQDASFSVPRTPNPEKNFDKELKKHPTGWVADDDGMTNQHNRSIKRQRDSYRRGMGLSKPLSKEELFYEGTQAAFGKQRAGDVAKRNKDESRYLDAVKNGKLGNEWTKSPDAKDAKDRLKREWQSIDVENASPAMIDSLKGFKDRKAAIADDLREQYGRELDNLKKERSGYDLAMGYMGLDGPRYSDK